MRYNIGMKRCVVLASFVLVTLIATVAAAQQVDLTAPAPRQERGVEGVIGPSLQYELTQPDDARYLPPGPRVHHEPAFIEPLSTSTESAETTGRVGVAGWTAPTAAMGGPIGGYREITGYFAFGLAFEWGGPPPKPPVR